MRKYLLALFALISIHSFSATEKEITFDFNKPLELDFTPVINSIPLGNGDVLNITDYTVSLGPISIKFTKGVGTLGAAINRSGDSYSITLRSFCELVFTANNGCQLSLIKFYNTNSLTIPNDQPGRFNISTNTWTSDGASNVKSLILTNGPSDSGISKVTVRYISPSVPLNFVSSSPADGGTTNSFQTMALSFSSSVTKINSGTITLSGTGVSGAQTMAASANGSKVTLSIDKAITEPGDYEVKVPAGVFENADGSTNEAISIKFSIVPEYDSFNPVEVYPADESKLSKLPQVIKLTFGNFVKIGSGTIKFKSSTGMSFSATATIDEADQRCVLITHDYVDAEECSWSVDIPEKIFHNDFPEDDADYRWNKALTLTYYVEPTGEDINPLDSETMKEAKALLRVSGVGYPTHDSQSWLNLAEKVNAEETPSDEDLAVAITNLYNETVVTMPETGGWYKIAGVNSAGATLYLTFSDDMSKVVLGTDYYKAAAFKIAECVDHTIVFTTKDGRFLHVPSSVPNYGKTSTGTNLTEERSDELNTLTVEKFLASSIKDGSVTPKDLFGKLTIKGFLDVNEDNGNTPEVYARLTYTNNGSISTTDDVNVSLVFNESRSNAFILEPSAEPTDLELVIPKAGLSPVSLAQSGDDLVLVVSGPASTSLARPDNVYWAVDGNKIEYNKTILAPGNSTNQFKVFTEGLAKGQYQLVMPEGTFAYESESGTVVLDKEMVATLTILSDGVSTVMPKVLLSRTEIESGSEVLLTFANNIKEAKLNADAKYMIQTEDGWEDYPYQNRILSTRNKLEFYVNTKGLKIGTYRLFIPAYTFTYEPLEESQKVQNVDLTVELTVKEPGTTSTTKFFANYDDYIVIFPASKIRTTVFYADVDLNELILFVYDFMHPLTFVGGKLYYGLVPDKSKQVLVRNTLTGGTAMTGHFEPYDNFILDYGADYVGTYAIKFVPDKPLKAGDLKNSPGIYGYYCPEGTFGDANYGAWLDGASVEEESCRVNPSDYIVSYQVNNTYASTGISNITVDDTESSVIYDMQGRRVSDMSRKGVYIVNGRKVVRK